MSAPAPPKIVFPPVAPVVDTAPAGDEAPVRKASPVLPLTLGALASVCALALMLVDREPQSEALDLTAAFSCPAGTAPSKSRMHVTASTLNVRAGPGPKADRLNDRTLRKKATVTEECRAGTWSRVRLVDGRAGWVSNEFLAPATLKR